MTDELAHNWNQVNALRSAMAEGEHGLSTVPDLLAGVLREESWREFVTKMGEHVKHERFTDFVTEKPLAGIGASPELLYRIAPEMKDELDKAFGRKVRADKITANVDIVHDSDDLERPAGNSSRRALRKLRKDAPELHADVIAGRLSAHRAMVQAGFRPRTITVPISRPEAIAKTLRKHMDPEDLALVIKLLADPK